MSADQTPDNEWQRVWISIRQQGWTSLALVPSDANVDVASVANMLATTGRRQGERPVDIVDATGADLEDIHRITEAVSTAVDRGSWVILPVDPILANPSAIALVRSTSAALLVIRLGESLLTTAKDTIDAVGRERFLGSIALDGASKPSLR